MEREGADTLLAIISPGGAGATQAEQAALAYVRGDYRKVATLTGYELGDIYPMTQNLEKPQSPPWPFLPLDSSSAASEPL